MEPIDFVGALRRSWRLLLALGLIGAVIAVLMPVSHPAKKQGVMPWQSSTVVGSAPNGGGNLVGGAVTSAQIQFYATSEVVMQATAKSVGLNVPAYLLSEYMTAAIGNAPPAGSSSTSSTTAPKRGSTSSLVTLTGHAKTAADAISLANAYATVVGNYLGDVAFMHLYLSGKLNASNVSTTTTTAPKSDPSNSIAATGYEVQVPAQFAVRTAKSSAGVGGSRKVRGLVGLAVGVAIGAGIVLLREVLDRHLRSAARAAEVFGFPVVAEMPSSSKVGTVGEEQDPGIDVVTDPGSPRAEAYRMLRMSVLFEGLAPTAGPTNGAGYGMVLGGGLLPSAITPTEAPTAPIPGSRKVVLVVSAATEPSRPFVAANLAAAYAEAGQQVVVISTGDVEGGPLGSSAAGLAEEIGTEDVRAQLEPSTLEHVFRLPLRPFIKNSGQLVTRAPAVLDAARRLSDVVIVEAPPLLAFHHAEALCHAVDVVLVVGECGSTTFDEARRAGDLLRRRGAPVLGVVVTNVHLSRRDIRHAGQAGPPLTASPSGRDEVLAVAGVSGPSATQTQV